MQEDREDRVSRKDLRPQKALLQANAPEKPRHGSLSDKLFGWEMKWTTEGGERMKNLTQFLKEAVALASKEASSLL